MKKNAETRGAENYEISNRGSNFSKFTLNLTQTLLNIQKDNASELQSKEQFLIIEIEEAIIEKSVGVSKRSIVRGVKKRKRAERDRDDSDFVFSKRTKKTCKEIIPQARAEITYCEFE